MENPRTRMGSLQASRKIAATFVKRDAEVNEILNPRRPFRAENFYRFPVTQPRSGTYRIGDMLGDAIIGKNCRGNASLSPPCVALGDLRFGHKRDSKLTAKSQRRD
jgi:hypothetical protein